MTIYKEAMLSTINNPFDPFDQPDEWYAEDCRLAIKENRNTCNGYLALVDWASDEVSDNEYNQIRNDVIDEIVALNLSGTFIKVTRDPHPVYVESA